MTVYQLEGWRLLNRLPHYEWCHFLSLLPSDSGRQDLLPSSSFLSPIVVLFPCLLLSLVHIPSVSTWFSPSYFSVFCTCSPLTYMVYDPVRLDVRYYFSPKNRFQPFTVPCFSISVALLLLFLFWFLSRATYHVSCLTVCFVSFPPVQLHYPFHSCYQHYHHELVCATSSPTPTWSSLSSSAWFIYSYSTINVISVITCLYHLMSHT